MADVHVGQQMVDATAPQVVQVQIRRDGKVVWVNVDGVCRFRACQIKVLEVDDQREGGPCPNGPGDGSIYHCHDLACPQHGQRNRIVARQQEAG